MLLQKVPAATHMYGTITVIRLADVCTYRNLDRATGEVASRALGWVAHGYGRRDADKGRRDEKKGRRDAKKGRRDWDSAMKDNQFKRKIINGLAALLELLP